ncbi:Late embryogenesis abundant (LEA) hydroxyproline-rich glycoprotein family [Striga hermonthica]|uniref:Late embryogenesis abundant (LEA) hydroxyproline-rich glycoprotein family n=1 Tax=Striga hermonthica TaxID=68872 RepID=A0A9N7RNM6_STRHE|nr:Late embryogenesis abundant (LEA) hydroxyproline-rich glycoprotein family [Striga hermonthica]
MTAAKSSDTSSIRRPLLPEPHPPPQYIVVLPPQLPPYRTNCVHRGCCRRRLTCSAVLLILAAAAYVLWPSDPKLSVVRLSLGGLHFHTSPQISLDLTLDLTVKVWNKDFYSIDYESLKVSIGYRGRKLGFMTSDGGRVRARRSSYINATLALDGAEVLSDAIPLLEDLARGSITFDTESKITGKLGIFSFDLPLKARIWCEVIVNTHNQTITHQNCYPD